MQARQVLVTLFVFLFVVPPLRAADRDNDPNVVYEPALYQALRYRLIGPYRGGRVTAVTGVAGELWTYYMHIYADPVDENTIYAQNTRLYKSVDGGKTFSAIATPHGDDHDLWIHPDNPNIMIEGNDGGANVTYDGGKNWSSQRNQPTAEFYRVTVDDQFLYRVYGCQQDNSAISIPSRMQGGLAPEAHWGRVGGGESGHVAVDPRNPNITIGGNYGGEIYRLNNETGEVRNIIVYPVLQDGIAVRDLDYRFQWNAPIRFSPHDPNVLYHTSHVVHRTRNEGLSWETISPDLTTNNKEQQVFPGGPITHDHTGVEVYNTIFALEESPHTPGLLWAGTDDGLIHISKDGGESWKNITPGDMPEGGTVNMIELSAHHPGRAFAAVYRYREDDFNPYLFRTDDYGESWNLLTNGTNGIPEGHFVRVVREDPDRKGLLYAGGEFGIYVSFDDGRHWQTLQLNLPVTPVTDLAVHRKDLVVATQGRSFWILDDLSPLHPITPEVSKASAHLFEPRDAYRVRLGGPRGDSVPENPPQGAVFFYHFADAPQEEVTVEILDAEGQLVRRFSSESSSRKPPKPRFGMPMDSTVPAKAGMIRFVWDLTYPGPVLGDDALMYLGYSGGPTAVPGTYQVRIHRGDWSAPQDPINFPPQLDTRFGCLYGYVHRLNGKPTEGAYKRFEDLKPLLETELTRLQAVLDTELADFLSLLRQKGAQPVVMGHYR